MGQLVFQATLGGQVNLVGPNTASTYNINVPAVAGNMVTTGDTGTVTNTMCASSVYTAPGTIGSGTPNSGAFTTLSASSTVSGTGFSTYLASPPAIGGTAAAAITGTNIIATSGLYAKSTFGGSYSDGIVADYTTGLGRISVGSSDGLAFYNGGVATTELMRIDSSGNVGINVVPSAWSGFAGKSLQFNYGSIFNDSAATFGYTSNAYYNGGWKYYGTGKANVHQASDGAYYWFGTNTSGSAGGSISLSQNMTLDASGRLLVNGTTATNVNGATSQIQAFATASTNGISVTQNAAGAFCFGANAVNNGGTYYLFTWNAAGTSVGSVTSNGTLTAYNVSSDYRLKENIVPLTGALDKISQLKPSLYNYKSKPEETIEGFIAHELQAVVPHAVTGEKDAVDADGNPVYQGVDASFLIPHLVAGIQEQQAIITQLQADVAALKPQAAQ